MIFLQFWNAWRNYKNSQSFDWLTVVHLLMSLSNINLEYLHWDIANSFNAQTFMICEIKLKGCDTWLMYLG